jgi:hypothetical protein
MSTPRYPREPPTKSVSMTNHIANPLRNQAVKMREAVIDKNIHADHAYNLQNETANKRAAPW